MLPGELPKLGFSEKSEKKAPNTFAGKLPSKSHKYVIFSGNRKGEGRMRSLPVKVPAGEVAEEGIPWEIRRKGSKYVCRAIALKKVPFKRFFLGIRTKGSKYVGREIAEKWPPPVIRRKMLQICQPGNSLPGASSATFFLKIRKEGKVGPVVC